MNDYDLSKPIQGAIFAINAVLYTVGTFLTPYIVPAWIERRVAMILILILLGVGTAFIGPFYEE